MLDSTETLEYGLYDKPVYTVVEESCASAAYYIAAASDQIFVDKASLVGSIGVLITDHNVRETLGICDRAYIISEGSVLAEGSPADIIQNAEVRKVYLGEHFRM